MTRNIPKFVFSFTVAIFFITSATIPAVKASVIDTSSYLQTQNHSYRTEIQALFNHNDVQKQLVNLGVKPEDARDRIAALTDQELMELQQRINDLPVGSDALAVLGVVLLVLIVLELLGVTNVFNKL